MICVGHAGARSFTNLDPQLIRGGARPSRCCIGRIVIHGYLNALSRPEQVMYFFRQVLGVPTVSKEIFSQRTADYQSWGEAFVLRSLQGRPCPCLATSNGEE
jgi:hypothetical protein